MIKSGNIIRVFSVFVSITVFMTFSSRIQADEFEDMMSGEMSEFSSEKMEFETYREQVLSEFETYQKIVDQEFGNYKSEIMKYWGKPVVSDKKTFVEYSPDFRIRKKVDFENENIEVSIIVPKGESPEKVNKKIDTQLRDLVTENSKTAFERDKLSQNIEKRLSKEVKNLKKAKVEAVPVITDIITDTAKPLAKQVKKVVKKLRENEQKTIEPSSKLKDSEVVTVKINLPSGSMARKAATYIGKVKKYAVERKIDPALLLAVMQTESAFNPMAKSYVPAYGLMQIVPKSAGLDASELVFGKQKILSPSYLYNGENNIKIGAAYLYILNYRYLKSVKNEKSRLYCVIAAYNTGAGNVARTFTGKTNICKAAKRINGMTPSQVYNRLVTQLPYDETRHYLKNVTKRIKLYK